MSNYFHYDARLRRYAMQDSAGLTYLTWDTNGMNLLAERDYYGNLTAQYSHGYTPIDGIGSMAAAEKIRGDVTYYQYPVYDHRGSVAKLVDQNGSLVASYEYDAWGNVLSGSQSGASNRFNYQSNWLALTDSHDELLLSPSRVYHTSIGRFLARDIGPSRPRSALAGGSLHNSVGASTYATGNRPTTVDPTGWWSLDFIDGYYEVHDPYEGMVAKVWPSDLSWSSPENAGKELRVRQRFDYLKAKVPAIKTRLGVAWIQAVLIHPNCWYRKPIIEEMGTLWHRFVRLDNRLFDAARTLKVTLRRDLGPNVRAAIKVWPSQFLRHYLPSTVMLAPGHFRNPPDKVEEATDLLHELYHEAGAPDEKKLPPYPKYLRANYADCVKELLEALNIATHRFLKFLTHAEARKDGDILDECCPRPVWPFNPLSALFPQAGPTPSP